MKNMRILITGKNSYIGTSFEQYASAHYPGEFEADTLDMKDGSWREKDFSGYDAVFHVAGIAHADVGNVTEEEKNRYYLVNTELAAETAAKAKAAGVGQFIFMSSMIVYGAAENVTKETEPHPANFYGDSKWQADRRVRELAAGGFQVAVLRPPMVYGRGSRGNYPSLAKLAQKLPVFPKVKNRRSVLYIENLCEFLCCLIRDGRGGIFFPQNRDPVSTSDLVKEIGMCTGHKIWITSLLTPFAALGRHLPGKAGSLCRKAFGNSCYDPEMGRMDWDYQVADLRESIRRTEGRGGGDGSAGPGMGTNQGRSDVPGSAEECPKRKPTVTITTVTYNSEKTLARTLESVLNQTYERIEYFIVDGLSDDGTVKLAESYREKFAAKGYEYKIISEPDRGMYDAINKGIRLSKGEIIGNINSDDWFEREAVERAVRFLEDTGNDFMYGDLRMIRPDGTAFIKRAKQQRLATSRGWNHPTQFARREIYLRWPYKLESLHDDFDLFLKVKKSGYRVGILNQVLANFTMEGVSHDRRLSAAVARGKCRYRIYRNNGYSRCYLLECIMIEAAKMLLG